MSEAKSELKKLQVTAPGVAAVQLEQMSRPEVNTATLQG